MTDLPPDHSDCAVTLVQLAAYHCRWPLGDPGPDMPYCGDAAAAGYPYCTRHCRLAYKPLPARRAA